MEKTIKNYKLSLILVLISYILMIVFNFTNFFDGNILHILYGLVALVLIVMMVACLKMINEVIENSVKLANIIAPIVLIIMLLDGFFFGSRFSPFHNFRVLGWIQIVGSIDILIRCKKISASI